MKGKTRCPTALRNWEVGLRNFLLSTRGYFIARSDPLLRMQLFCYACGYFCKGFGNFMHDSMQKTGLKFEKLN